jgi:hypothetical protein
VVADFNGDGKPDFAVADASGLDVQVFLNTTPAHSSTASFSVFTLQDAKAPGAIAAVTLNGAGHLPDLVVENLLNGSLTVFMNQTTLGSSSVVFSSQSVPLGLSAPLAESSSAQVPYKIVTGDFNDDGSPDLAIAGYNTPLIVLINTTPDDATTASFGTPLSLALGSDSGYTDLAIGDFNLDGEDDIAYVESGTGKETPDTLYVLLSTTPKHSSTPSFSQQNFVVGESPLAVLVADLNQDGRPDIAVSSSDATVTILLNTTATDASAATFSAKGFQPLYVPTLMVTGDFNGDGRTDLAVQGLSDEIAVLENNTPKGSSTPAFGITTDAPFDLDSSNINMVSADFLGNGLSDLATTTSSTGLITMFNNTTNTTLKAEVQENPAKGSGSFSIASPAGTILKSNTWYYVTFTYTPNVDSNGDDQLTLYVNGQMVAQSTGTGSLPSNPDISGTSTLQLLIGAETGTTVSDFFSGYLDDVSIWPEALTEEEIQAVYGGGMEPSYIQTTPTSPSTYTAAIPNTTTLIQGDNFGAFDTATITGTITGTPLDSSASEPLSGWTVELLNPSGQVTATAKTGTDGLYFFFDVLPGTYTVKQVLQSGWDQSTPSGDANITVTAAEGAVYPDENFTNTQVAQVTGKVYIDANNNGIDDPGEAVASGITVYLDTNDNGQLDPGEPSALTQSNGVYTFTGLAPGNYIVRVSAAAVGVTTQPSPAFYTAQVTARGSVSGLEFGLSPLVIAPIANVSVAEGSPISFLVSLTHAEAGQPATFYLAPGAPAGAAIDPGSGLFAWTPPTPGTYSVTVSTVAAGTPLLNDTQTFTVTVNDVAPVVHLGSNVQLTLGDPFAATGSFTEPGTDPWTVAVDYGDGQGPQPLLLGLNKTFDLDHVYAFPGTYTVSVVVNDGFGGIGVASMAVFVVPGPPPPAVPLSSGFGAGRDAFVKSFYGAVLGQNPNQASLSYWSGMLLAGESTLTVARRIWKSPEHSMLKSAGVAPNLGFRHAYRQALRAGRVAARMDAGTH